MVERVKSKIKNVNVGAKSAVVYTLSILFSRGLAILSVPIFTRIMSTSEMGVVNLYNSWYSIISSIATLSLTSGGYIVALKEFSDNRDEYQSSVLSLTSIIALVITLVFAINPTFWERVLGLPIHLLWLMALGFLFAPARDFWLARQRFEYKYIIPGVITIGSAIIATVLSVCAVIYSDKIGIESTATYRLFANYIVIYGVSFVIWFGTFKKGKTFFVKEYWVLSLQLSIPLVGYAVATQILNVSDQMMISKMVDNSSVGIYGTIYTVSSLSLMVWGAIHSSFVPYLYQNIDKPNPGVKKVSRLLVFMYGMIAVLATYLAPEIVAILATEEYYEAIYIMPPIAAGVFLTCLTNLYSDIPVYFKKTKYVMYPAIIAAVLNLILNYIFIGIYGYMAAAYTTMASYVVWVILQIFWANLIEKQQGITEGVFNNKILSAISILTMVLCMAGIPLYNFKVIRYVAACAIIVIALFAAKSIYTLGQNPIKKK